MEIQDGVMTKAEAMDKRMDSYTQGISSSEIMDIVHQIFKFNLQSILDTTTSPQGALDAYLENCGNNVTGVEIRKMINQTFGINLDALSALEGSRISIYSKGYWMIQQETDLFVVQTGAGDVDVRILPTNYFAEQTGSGELPLDLRNALLELGYEENTGSCYYSNPTGEPVPDAFKGQTMMAIRNVIQHSYSHL